MGSTEKQTVHGKSPRQPKPPDAWSEALMVGLLGIGCVLLVFAAMRNSLTWHLQQFWGASGDFWQSQWEKLHDKYGHDHFHFFFWGTLFVSNIAFWGLNLVFMTMDVTNKPEFLTRYKVQEDKNVPMDMNKFWHAVRWTLFNSTVVSAVALLIAYPLALWRGYGLGRELPTFNWVLFELLVFAVCEEIGFYYTHRRYCTQRFFHTRLMHNPVFYKRIHKKHHEWTAPIGIIALYSHPFEHLFSNLMPVGLGPFIMGSHIATVWLWIVAALTSTIISHCGYHFPLLPSPEFHDFHHFKFHYCYGVFGVLDRLHGTDTMFRSSKAFQRHKLLLGLTPLNRSVPNESSE